MCRLLDERRPESAPHGAYVGFRYARPLAEDTIRQMEEYVRKQTINWRAALSFPASWTQIFLPRKKKPVYLLSSCDADARIR